jgi:NADH-quinone oxidoreductase subunit N
MNAILLSAVWGVLMMYSGFMTNNKKVISFLALLGVALLFAVNWLEYNGVSFFLIDSRGMLAHSTFGLVFNAVILFSTLVYFLLSGTDIEKSSRSVSDLYALIFFVLCGIAVIAGFKSLLMLFIGIEIITIPLYVLAGSDKLNLKSNEAALKYFLMGTFSTGLMLMGIAFLYGDSATFYLDGINAGLSVLTPMKAIGMVLLLAAMSFKVSAAPFHFWTPDVYDGTPTVYTSFMATIVKSAAFFAFLKLFENAFGQFHADWQPLVAVVTALTLIIGNLTAVFQQSVKRILSYSSIAQAGFMMLGLFAMNIFAKQGMVLYFAAYSLATMGIFAVLARFKDHSIEAFNGFAKQHPVVAFSVLVSLLSLAGIPLTAGFFAKYYMLLAVLKNGQLLWLVVVAILCAAVSVYYYFRLVQAMYFKAPAEQDSPLSFNGFFKTVIVLNAILLLVLGIHPDWLLVLI